MKKILLSFVMLVGLIGPQLHATPTVSTSTKGDLIVAEIYLENAGELSTALQNDALSGGYQYLHLSTNNNVDLNAADLAALANVNVQTIEMQHVKATQPFTFSNSNVQYFILPYAWAKDDVLTVEGKSLESRYLNDEMLKGGEFTSSHDHRMAMALTVASFGTVYPIGIDDTKCIAKSFPDFLNTWKSAL